MNHFAKFGAIILISAFFAQGNAVLAQDSMYQRCEPGTDCIVGEFIFADDGHTPVTADNYCQITVTNPGDTVVINGASMNHKNDGWYYYTVNVASPNGMYRATMCCDTGAARACEDKTFVLGTSMDSLATKTDLAAIAGQIWSYTGGRTLTALGSLAADVWNNTFAPARRLTDKTLTGGGSLASESYLDAQKTDLLASIGDNTTLINNNISSRSSQASVDAIRASQQQQWQVYISGSDTVQTGNAYRAKVWILNYESVPTDPAAPPTVTIYDAVRNAAVTAAPMARISTGIYEYVFNVSSSAVQGNWETAAAVQVEAGKTIQASDFWNVAGAPAQIKINSFNSTTVPDISANITLTNEGSTNYEYSYEWCVVSSQDNACGGSDDVFYSSAAKLLQPGQNWDTNLDAIVPSAGNYWFKVIVHFGGRQSGASQSFTAVKQTGGGGGGGGGSSGGGVISSGGQANLAQNVVNGLSSAGQVICNQNTFPCNIILKILAWMGASDKKTADLENKISQLDKKMTAMANVPAVKAAPPKINIKPVPQKAPEAKKRANFFVE